MSAQSKVVCVVSVQQARHHTSAAKHNRTQTQTSLVAIVCS